MSTISTTPSRAPIWDSRCSFPMCCCQANPISTRSCSQACSPIAMSFKPVSSVLFTSRKPQPRRPQPLPRYHRARSTTVVVAPTQHAHKIVSAIPARVILDLNLLMAQTVLLTRRTCASLGSSPAHRHHAPAPPTAHHAKTACTRASALFA